MKLQTIEVSDELKALSVKQVLNYNCQYLDEEPLVRAYFGDESTRCEECESLIMEEDINSGDCPASFEFGTEKCIRWSEYYYFKLYVMQVDLMLRHTLGEYWSDEYSAR